MSQGTKKGIAPKIQKLAKEYGVKCSLAVRHHSTIVLNINSGQLDFIGCYNEQVREHNKYDPDILRHESDGSYIQVNDYYLERTFIGECLAFLEQAKAILYGEGYYNRSDSQTDYFDVAYYVRINIGRWNKPYQYMPLTQQVA